MATPLTAFWVVVPPSVPPPGLVPMASVIGAELLATRLLLASRTRTVTAGVMGVADSSLVGCWRNASLLAGPKTLIVPLTVLFEPVQPLAVAGAVTVNPSGPSGVLAEVVILSVEVLGVSPLWPVTEVGLNTPVVPLESPDMLRVDVHGVVFPPKDTVTV